MYIYIIFKENEVRGNKLESMITLYRRVGKNKGKGINMNKIQKI